MKPTILVADDEIALAMMVKSQLELDGYTVILAHDGEQAVQLALAHHPEVILMDYMMPNVNGVEASRRIRAHEDTHDTPIIMLTSMTSLNYMQSGFDAGVDDYLAKPYDYVELKMRMAAVMRRRSPDDGDDHGKVITVFSLRGGAGTSSIATNIAMGLSLLWNKPTNLMDLALPIGLCDIMLNLRTQYSITGLAALPIDEIDRPLVKNHLVRHEHAPLWLLSSGIDPAGAEKITDNMISYVLGHLRSLAPYTVIDTAHNFSAPILAALDMSDDIVVPITPDINSVRLTAAMLKVFDALGYPREKLHIVINWTFPRAGLPTERIEKHLGHPVHMVIPHTPAVWSEAINNGTPVILNEERTPLTAMLEDLAWRLSSPKDTAGDPERPTPMYHRVTARHQAQQSEA